MGFGVTFDPHSYKKAALKLKIDKIEIKEESDYLKVLIYNLIIDKTSFDKLHLGYTVFGGPEFLIREL